MHESWVTIVAPVLDAARPGLTVDADVGDEHLTKLVASFVEPWEGRVQSWRRQARGEPPPGEAEVVLASAGGDAGSVGELLEAMANAAEQAGRPLPVMLIHGVDADDQALTLVRRFATTRIAAGSPTDVLVVPGLGGVAIVTESPMIGDTYGRLAKLLGELRLSRAAGGHVAAIESRRLAERAHAERGRARLAVAQERASEHETLLVERDELRERVRELADALASRCSNNAGHPVG
jgi:hypothetical protein